MRNVNAARSAPAGRLDDPRDEVLARSPGRSTRGSRRSPLVARQVEVAAVVDALELLPAEREAVLDVDRLLGVVRQLVRGVLAEAQPLRGHAVALVPGPAARAATPRRSAAASASGRTKYCISICSNSRIRNTKLPGEISLRKLLPIWAIPNGSFLRDRLLDVLEVDVRALGRLGAQVDDRGVLLDRAHERLEHEVEPARRATAARRRPGTSGRAARRCPGRAGPSRSGPPRRAARRAGSGGGRSAHSTSGSLNDPTWPDVTHTCGCMRIPASSPTMSSRSWTIARHQARLTLFFSSTPSGP